MGGGSVMVFGLIGSDGFLSIRKINGAINGEKHVKIMNEDILDMLKSGYSRPHT